MKKNKLKITSRTCFACPTVYNLEFSNGETGWIKFRYGTISLWKDSEKKPVISEQISDDLDGVISLNEIIKWFKKLNYTVEVDTHVYNQLNATSY